MILDIFLANVLVERCNVVHEINADIQDFVFQQTIDDWYDPTYNIIDFKLIRDFTKNFSKRCSDMLASILDKPIQNRKNRVDKCLLRKAGANVFQLE